MRIEETTLYTRPATPPRIVGAAVTAETARWVGGWADALITVGHPHDELARIVDAFREGGGDGKPMCLQVQLAYGRDDEPLRREAHEQGRTNIVDSHVLTELRRPELFEGAARFIRPEDMPGRVRISADTGRHVEWLKRDIELGFSELYLHHVGRDQRAFIDAFAGRVLPELRFL